MKLLRTLPLVLPLVSSLCYAGSWVTNEAIDKMDSSKTITSAIRSDNSLALRFPYAGENRGQIIVRNRKSDGLNVMVTVDKGQLVCRYGDDCTVTIRFDEAPPVRFTAAKPADHSSTVLFLNNEKRFVEQAVKAKRILVSLEMYQSGTQILEFETATPLVWEAPKVAVKKAPVVK
jgi:hypothetical protein